MVKYTTFEFEEHGDERGILISLEENRNIPFDIRRCYFMYNTQPGISRGFHAHKTLRQVLVCVRGSCRILLDDGKEKASVLLDRPNKGLYITSNLWRVMTDFSEDAVLMVLADQLYDESDYIRDYDAFLAYLRDNGEKKPDQESILPEENK
jgi:dTDP-4-dehydrorhamnose 3,5-epimerase-like enzyme